MLHNVHNQNKGRGGFKADVDCGVTLRGPFYWVYTPMGELQVNGHPLWLMHARIHQEVWGAITEQGTRCMCELKWGRKQRVALPWLNNVNPNTTGCRSKQPIEETRQRRKKWGRRLRSVGVHHSALDGWHRSPVVLKEIGVGLQRDQKQEARRR